MYFSCVCTSLNFQIPLNLKKRITKRAKKSEIEEEEEKKVVHSKLTFLLSEKRNFSKNQRGKGFVETYP